MIAERHVASPLKRPQKKMKTIIGTLFIVLASSTAIFAQDTKTDYGFAHVEDLRTNGYDFRFLRATPDENHWRMGYFKFRWNGDKAIQLWGFGFEKDGSFRVRFENFSKKSGEGWEEVKVGYCGTGAEMFTLQANKDYILQIPLWPYKKGGDVGVVKLDGEKISVVSDPFTVADVTGKR